MRKKILVVDDEPTFGKLLQRIIPDYELRQATSSTVALEMAHQWRPDLFILDLKLPDLDGEELARLIRRDPELGQTPILFISAFVRRPASTEEPVLLHGVPAFAKPFSIPILRRCVAQQLVVSKSPHLWN